MTEEPVCDLCGTEGPVSWEWETPNLVNSEEEARKQGVFYVEDPRWHICELCHHLVTTEQRDVLLKRALLNVPHVALGYNAAAGEWGKIDMLEHVTLSHAVFWDQKTDCPRSIKEV